jgi:RimJ/RimL family protein N-acetyltransferase
MTVAFAHVDPALAREVFQWHRGFAAANQMLFPRSWTEYEDLANDGRIVCATEDGHYVGLCYYTWDETEEEWEIGGLMVDTGKRGRSLGSVLMRVTLAHLLFEEEPLSRHERIISHVHKQNDSPRRVIEGQLAKLKRRSREC